MRNYEDLCKNWKVDSTDPQVREAFLWLKADPLDKNGRLTRELGILKPGGDLIKLRRVRIALTGPDPNIVKGYSTGLYRQEPMASGSDLCMVWAGHVSVSARDFCFPIQKRYMVTAHLADKKHLPKIYKYPNRKEAERHFNSFKNDYSNLYKDVCLQVESTSIGTKPRVRNLAVMKFLQERQR